MHRKRDKEAVRILNPLSSSLLLRATLVFLGILSLLFQSALPAFCSKKGLEPTDTNHPHIAIEPKILHPGQAGLIRIEFSSKGLPLWVKLYFEGREIPLKKEDGSCFLGFVPVSLKASPGNRPLTLSWLPAKDAAEQHLKVQLKIEAKEYKKEYLKVSKKMVEFSKKTLQQVLDDQKAVKAAARGSVKGALWELPFIWPIDTRITSPFGLRRFFNKKPRSPHSGVDLKAAEGQPILAANSGVVTLARRCYLSGNTVVIDHGGGVATIYAHLSKMDVKKGQRVEKGQIIGLAGSTGRVTGPHLHWGVSILGIRVDPEAFMAVAGTPLTGSKLNAQASKAEK